MGFFFKKKVWDTARSDANKAKMRELFNGAVKDGESYRIAFGYSQEARLQGVLVTKSVTTFASLIVGYRVSDMSIVLLQTTVDVDRCGEPELYKKEDIKKAGIVGGEYTIWNQGGIMAGNIQFGVADENDEDYLAYVYQPEEAADFESFWKQFSR